MYFETEQEENFFNAYIDLMYNSTSDNPPFIKLTEMKRQNPSLYERCRTYKRTVDLYVERANMREGKKIRITKDNFKQLLDASLRVGKLGKQW